jgi:hypothetical protein
MTDIILTSAFWIAAFALFLHFRQPGALKAGVPAALVTELSALGLIVSHDGQAAIKRFEEFEASFHPETLLERIITAMDAAFKQALADLETAFAADKAAAVAEAARLATEAANAAASTNTDAAKAAGAAEATAADVAAVQALTASIAQPAPPAPAADPVADPAAPVLE